MIDLSLLQDFITESGEHLEEMETSLLRLETQPDNKELLNNVFRSIHTIKGSAEYLGMEKIAELSHKLENLLEIIRHGDRVPDTEMIDTLIDSRDRISKLVHDLEYEGTEKTEINDLLERIETLDSPPAATKFPDIPELALDPDPDPQDPSLPAETLSESPPESSDLILLDDEALLLEQDFDEQEPVEKNYHEDNSEDTECYEEEYDDELFDIFIQHLKENLVLIKAQLIGLSQSPAPLDILNKCLATLSSLRSSANYMDYEKIIKVYDIWQEELEKAVNAIENKESLKIAGPDGKVSDITSVTDAFIEGIVKFFPRLKFSILQEAGIDSLPSEKKAAPNDNDILPVEEENFENEDFDFEDEDFEDEHIDLSDDDLLLTDEDIKSAEDDSLPRDEESDYNDDELTLTNDDLIMTENDSVLMDKIISEPDEKPDIEPDIEPDEEDFQEDEILEPEEIAEETKAGSGADYQGLFDELDCFFSKSPVGISYKNAVSAFQKTSEAIEPEISKPVKSLGTDKVETGSSSDFDQPHLLQPELHQAELHNQETIQQPVPVANKDKSPVPVKASKPIQKSKTVKPEKKPAPISELRPAAAAEKVVKQSIRVDAGKIDDLMNQVGELVVSRAWFSQLHVEMKGLQTHLQESMRGDQRVMKPVKAMSFRISEAIVALGRVANDLQEGVMKVRMLPIAQLFNRYPRLVRDLIHDVNKQVRLEIIGEETELDKMVIEEIADPLVHIIRNAVDHGCEETSERYQAGKPEECTLHLRSYHESNHVVIEVSDDGRGIDPEKIKAAALEKEIASKEELDRMTDRELISLIMKPGFSTAARISRTSGRGVGMDVVKENIEKLNGTIEIDSRVGEGSRFRIKIPLTLAIIQALLVRVGMETFTVPLTAVEETLRINKDEITTIESVECIYLRNSTLSLIRLSGIFNIRTASDDPEKSFVVVVNTGMRRVGLVVDELIGQEETVIKPIVDYLQEKSGFSGATILGDGRISLILDVYELVNLSIGAQAKLKGYAEIPGDMMIKNNTFPAAAQLH